MNLTESGRQRILVTMVGSSRDAVEMVRNVAGGSFCAMVVDEETLRVLSSFCKVFDLLDSGVSVIESITKSRQSLPELDAIYFLRPRKESIELLLNDFRSEKKPQHRSVHIFWSTTIADHPGLLKQLANSPGLLSRLKTFVDLNLHFIAFEARAFHLDLPYALPRLFRSSSSSPFDGGGGSKDTEYIKLVATRLATACLTLGDKPRVRFYAQGPQASLNESLAAEVEAYFTRVNPEGLNKRNTTELVIIDRSIDPCALLVHEYTYQALAYDCLAIPICSPVDIRNKRTDEASQDDTYQFLDDKKQIQTLLLGEHDCLYVKYRHQHITLVIRGVAEELRKFSQDNAAAQYAAAGGKKATERDIASAIRSLPQYREMLAKFWAHITLSENCFNALQQQGVFKAGALEQDLATGIDKEGKLVQVMNCLSELGRLVAEKSGVMTPEKARLLLLYFIQMEGVQLEDRKKMMAAAGLSLDMIEIINRFLDFADDEQKNGSSLKHTHKIHRDFDRTTFYQRKAKSAEYELSRYEPVVKDLMERAASNRLHRGRFPYLSDPDHSRIGGYGAQFGTTSSTDGGRASTRAAQNDWDWSGITTTVIKETNICTFKNQNKNPTSNNLAVRLLERNTAAKKIIMFVIGGITLAEVRSAYEVSRQGEIDVYIGGTAILTPPTLFDLLRRAPEDLLW